MGQKVFEKYSNLKNSDIFSHISSLSYLPRWVVLFVDIVISIFSCIVSYYAVQLFSISTTKPILGTNWSFFIIICLQIFFFWIFHTYSGVLRYSNYVDAAKLLLAVLSNIIILSLLNLIYYLINDIYLFSNLGLLIYTILNFLLLFLVRLIVKVTYDTFSQSSNHIIPVMIYGTKSAAIGIAKMLRTDSNTKYKLIGFIDDNKNATQRLIMGMKVYLLNEKNVQNIISKKAKAIIVSPMKMKEINPHTDLDIFFN